MCAVIKRGILGGFQNKIANVVGGSWKGISYMRSLPISVSNPQTGAQTAQRNKFSGAVAFAVVILATVIKPLWDRFAQYQSGYNAFVSENIDAFAGGFLATPADLVISKGTLANPSLLTSAVDASAHTVALTWDTTPSGDFNPEDSLYVVLFNEGSSEAEGFDTGITRSTGTATLTTSIELTAGNTYYVYAAFRKSDGTKASSTDMRTGTIVA